MLKQLAKDTWWGGIMLYYFLPPKKQINIDYKIHAN